VLAQLCTVVIDFGLNQKLVLVGGGRRPKREMTMALACVKFCVAVIFLLPLILFVRIVYAEHFATFYLFILSGCFFSIFNFVSAFYRSEKNFKLELIGITLSNVVLFISFVILSELSMFNLDRLPIFFVISRAVPMAYGVMVFIRDSDTRFFLPPIFMVKTEFSKITPLAAITIWAFLYLYFDIFILEYFLGYASVAQYQLAFRLTMLAMIVPEIFNHLMLPYLAEKRLNDPARYIWLLRSSLKLLFLYSLIAGSLVYYLGPFVINVFFGDDYQVSESLVEMMVPLIIMRSIGAPLGLALLLEGMVVARLLIMVAAAVIGSIANVVAIPQEGIIAAVSISIFVHMLLNVGYWVKTRKIFYGR
jgi:O-antigen/teichoic acid export membrane protein